MKAFNEQFRHFTHTADGEKPLFEVVGKAFAKDSGWSRFVGGDPQVIYDDTATDGQCLRLPVVAYGDTFLTSAVWTDYVIGPGVLRIRARFKGGRGTWPAIWLTNHSKSIENYYEVDLCEYFERRKRCKTGVFFPKHMKSWWHRLWRPKSHPKINKEGWNTFEFVWDEKEMMLFVNGVKAIGLTNRGKAGSYPQTVEDMTFRLILSMQYGKK
ncbi:MAG: family 16 glycosylhydrolase, partial [Bacteroidaceae bacterium]